MCTAKHASALRPFRRELRFVVAMAVLAAALTACVPYELRQVLDGPDGKPLAISPAVTVVPVNGTVSFAAEGGIPPYVFSIASGGGVLNSATGAYSSSSTGSATIRVTDKTGKGADATVAVQAFAGSLTISPAALSLAVGSNVTFSASGGTSPYTFSFQANNSGSLSVGASGVTSWLYAPGGTSGVTDVIKLTDSTSTIVTASVTVTTLTSSVDYSVPATSFLPTGTVSTTIPGAPAFTLHNGGSAAGTQAVAYKVYLSTNNVLDGGDLLIASGTTGALAAGASFSVPVSGSYPAVAPGSGWNLIVEVSAADDTTTANNTSGAASLTLSPQDINYTVPGVTHSAGTTAGLAMSGTFTIKNVGTAAGVAGTTWTVHASTDTVLDGADYLIASGTQTALGAGVTSASIPFAGYWPSTPGTWYLLATVAAGDDIGPGNNTAASGSVTTTGAAPGNVDYTVVSVANAGGVAGDPLSGNFTIHNGGTDPGAQPVYWTAYLSSNATLELGTDPVLDSGIQLALGVGGTSGTISFNGTWPTAPGTWRLIVALSASDDSAPGNNVTVSGAVATTAASVDYVVWTIGSTGGTTAGGSLGGTLTIKNQG